MSYTQYYSGSDVFVYLSFGGKIIHLDKATGIGINENLDAFPVYGLGNSEYGFITQGNVIVQGAIDFNYIHEAYFPQAVAYVTGSDLKSKVSTKQITIKEAVSRNIEQLKTLREAAGGGLETGTKLHGIKRGFELLVVFNSTSPLSPDLKPTVIKIVDIALLNSGIGVQAEQDGQIVKRYGFVGKYQ